MPAKAHTAPRGFSLVEVMVALIVICVGLLGIAKLEALMLSSTGTSRLRSLVSLQAASLAASMHADRDYWDGSSSYWNPGGNPLSLTATEAAGTTTWSGSPAALATSVGSPPTCQESAPGSTSPPTCTSAQDMAAFDLSQWAGTTSGTTSTGMASVLKNSTTTIGCTQNTSANNVVTCTITITWQENTVAANSQEQQTGGGAFQSQTYMLVVEP
ncbi:MAG: type IV pilus modification PilV family protein [Steroidobacteraceae bacterium]